MRQVALVLLTLAFAATLFAGQSGTVSGTITDSLGAVVSHAAVELIENGSTLQSTEAADNGTFRFAIQHAGRYQVRASATTFRPGTSPEVFLSPSRSVEVDLTLSPSAVTQHIIVVATATPIPESQTGASVNVISREDLETTRDVQQALRLQPGVQATQSGEFGALASLFLRGGPSDANKVLIDGVEANDIGGRMDFAELSSAGYDHVELLRGPNSAIYGSDALASVISLTTRHGVTALPELEASADGGTFGTYHEDASLGGAWKQFDYFSDFSRFNTQNNIANNEYHKVNYLGNFGWQLRSDTSLRATVRRTVTDFNAPNQVLLFGIPDNAADRDANLDIGITLENRPNQRWHNLLRYGALRLRSDAFDFSPTGIPYDPFETGSPMAYLGAPVTIRGANGYTASGQAIFQYPGKYPILSSGLTNRDFVYAQTDYRFSSKLQGLLGFRYENEDGYTYFGSTKNSTDRGNYGFVMQVQGGVWNRLYYTLGSGIEDNAVFGVATTPRASLAYYLVKPRSEGSLSGTRLRFNFGKGIKEPSITDELSSLYRLLQGQPQLIAQYGIRPFRAELSRTYDAGVEQELFAGKARFSATYFHNEFGDQAQWVPGQGLLELGVPSAVLSGIGCDPAALYCGAAVNSLSYRSQGAELELEYHLPHNVTARGGWTYVDAVVQHSLALESFSPVGALLVDPASNPVFPGIPIGSYSPLVGARPFRIAPNSGYIAVDWNARRWFASFKGTFVSRRDDSDFLASSCGTSVDPNCANSLLLPNRNLDPAYQKLDLYYAYRISKRLTMYTSLENLLNQHYQEAFGYPAWPFTIRSGMKIRLGGESWKWE